MPLRPITPRVSSNYVGTPPLSTEVHRSDAIRSNTRPDIRAGDNNTLKEKNITAASTFVRDSIPLGQGGIIDEKEINNSTKKGYSRASVFNLLVAGNQNNLDRRINATNQQEEATVQKSIDTKQAGLPAA